jgi:predicted lysophospholipase L1 biosynthesis ABC-type transport system permease subunit
MNMRQIDWQYLRGGLIVFACLLTVAGALLWGVDTYHRRVDDAFHEQEREFSSAKRRYEEARRNRAVYQQHLSDYRRYMERGVIGEEQRLSWIEQLQALNEEYKLASLNYEISPQEEAELPGLDVPANVQLNVSRMELEAGLLHEGDAVSLWKEFRNQSKGFYAIKECELNSNNLDRQGSRDYRPYTAYVDMTCLLDWYTIKVVDS